MCSGQRQNANDILRSGPRGGLAKTGAAAGARSGEMSVVYRNELNSREVELEVRGDLNEATVNEFRTALYAELDRPHRHVKLNLENVHIINSAALGAILLFQKKAREEGKEIMIGKCSDELRRTIMAIRLDRIISMEGEAPPTVAG
jgi:stage II sporulation protein AA (anti-sigma F factor antagonist)